MSKITLEANPIDAPCCIKIVAENGADLLVQTDWDWPSVAGAFGFLLRSVQKCDCCGKVSFGLSNSVVKFCRFCPDKVGNTGTNVGTVCDHSGTDGTINCHCGVTAGDFISAARQWIDENDGAEAQDPGYFN